MYEICGKKWALPNWVHLGVTRATYIYVHPKSKGTDWINWVHLGVTTAKVIKYDIVLIHLKRA